MKKQWISAVLVVLLMLLIPVAASADVIYPAPDDFVVGEEVDHLLATLDPGGTAWIAEELLPEGLRLETEEVEDGVNVYLRGVPTTAGTYDLVIQYSSSTDDKSIFYSLRILPGETPEPTLTAIAVETPPTQTQYTAGDTLNAEGLTIRLEMSNGRSVIVTEGFSLYPTRLEKAGTQQIEVSYDDRLCFFEVQVEPAPEVIEGIGVLTLPAKVIYEPGDTLETAGLSIRVYTNNGTRDVGAEELECSPMLLETAGQQKITVRYGGETCSFEVQVLEEETPAAMSVYRLPEKLEYELGEPLDTEGLILIVTGSRDSVEYLDEGFTCEPAVLTEAGAQEITVHFRDLSCRFHVTVKETSEEPGVEPSPVVTAEPFPAPGAEPTVAPAEPSPAPLPDRQPDPQLHSGKVLVAVIVAAAVLALAILGVYVFVMNRSGKDYFAESVRDLFRRKR